MRDEEARKAEKKQLLMSTLRAKQEEELRWRLQCIFDSIALVNYLALVRLIILLILNVRKLVSN